MAMNKEPKIYVSNNTYTAFQSLEESPKTAFIWEYFKVYLEPVTINESDIDYSSYADNTGILLKDFGISNQAHNLIKFNRDNALATSEHLSTILSIQLESSGTNDKTWNNAKLNKMDLNAELFELLFHPQIGNEVYKAGIKDVSLSQKATSIMIEECTIQIYLQHLSLLAKPCFLAFLQMGRPFQIKFGYAPNTTLNESEYTITKKMTVTTYKINIDNTDGSAVLVINSVVSPVSKLSHSKFWNYLKDFANEYLPLLKNFNDGLRINDQTNFLSRCPITVKFLLAMRLSSYINSDEDKIIYNINETFFNDLISNASEVYTNTVNSERDYQKAINSFKNIDMDKSIDLNMSLGNFMPFLVDALQSEALKKIIYMQFPQYFFNVYEPTFKKSDNSATKKWWNDEIVNYYGPPIADHSKTIKEKNYIRYSDKEIEDERNNVQSNISQLVPHTIDMYKSNPFFAEYKGASGKLPKISYNDCLLPESYDPKTKTKHINGDALYKKLTNTDYVYIRQKAKLMTQIVDLPQDIKDETYNPTFKDKVVNVLLGIFAKWAGNAIVDEFPKLLKGLMGFQDKMEDIKTKIDIPFNAESIKDIYQEKIESQQSLLNSLRSDTHVDSDKVQEWLDQWLCMPPINILDSAIHEATSKLSLTGYYYFTESKSIQGINNQYIHIASDETRMGELTKLQKSSKDYMDMAEKGTILTVFTANDQNVFGGIEFAADVDVNMPYTIGQDFNVYDKNIKYKLISYLYHQYNKSEPENELTLPEIKEKLKTQLYDEIINDSSSMNYFGNNLDNVNRWLDGVTNSDLILDKIISEIKSLRNVEYKTKSKPIIQNSNLGKENIDEINKKNLLEDSTTQIYLDSLAKTLVKWTSDMFPYTATFSIFGIPDLRLGSIILIIDNRIDKLQKEKAKNVGSAIYIIKSINHLLEIGVYKTKIEARKMDNIYYENNN